MPTFGAYTGSKSPIMTWYGEYSYTRISNSTVRVSVTVTGEIKNHAASSWMGTGNNIMVYASAGGQSGSYEIKSSSSAWYGNTNNPRSCSFAFDVPSSAAGESISVSYSVAGSGYTAAAAVPTQSTSFASPALLYVASMPSAGNPTLGQPVTIYTNPQYPAEMTHTVQYRIGGDTVTIATGVGTSCQWTPPDSLAAYFPNATSGAAAIICTTYVGGTTIGTREIPVTLSIRKGDAEFKPTCSLSVELVPTSEPSGWGVAVKGYTKFRARISAAGKYGSTISSYSVSGDGYAGASADVISSGPFRSAGDVQIYASVTDSRGESNSASTVVPVYDYERPKFTGLQVYRCTSDGTAAENGTYVLVKADFAFSDVGGKNSLSAVVQWKKAKDSAFANTTSIQSGQTAILGAGAIDPNASYVFRVQLTDALTGQNPVYQDTPIASIVYPIFLRDGGKAVGIGKTADEDERVGTAWPIVYGGNHNQGSWNQPTTGAVTQIIDSSQAQHSVIVGRTADGTRVYGIDLLDAPSSPSIHIYSGSNFFGIDSSGAYFNYYQIPTVAVSSANHMTFKDATGTDVRYIRAGSEGLLPYQSGGNGTIGSQSWPFLTAYINTIHGTADGNAVLGSPNNLLHSGNEFTYAPDGYSGSIWHNYKTAGWNTNGNISAYYFGNGKGGYDNVDLYAGNFNGRLGGQYFEMGAVYIPAYSTSGSNGYNYYGDVSVSHSFSKPFSDYPNLVLQVGTGTTGVVALEPISWTKSGIQTIRVHRASSANGVDGFYAYYVAALG